MRFVEIRGTGDRTDRFNDRGFITALGSSDITIASSYIHDQGECNLHLFRTTNVSIDTRGLRGTIAARLSTPKASRHRRHQHFTLRYSVMEDIEGTAFIGTPTGGHPGCGGTVQRDWYLYGNVFVRRAGSTSGTGGGIVYVFCAPAIATKGPSPRSAMCRRCGRQPGTRSASSRFRTARGGAASEPRDSVAIVLSQEDYRRREGSTARYRGQFIVNLDRIEIVDVLPLQPAAESRQPGRRLVIDQVRMQSERVAVRLRQYLVSSASGPGNPLSFYLRNRRTSEAVAGSYADQIHHSLPFLGGLVFAGPGFTPGSYVARFPQDHVRDFAISADWLANAELVLVQQRRRAR